MKKVSIVLLLGVLLFFGIKNTSVNPLIHKEVTLADYNSDGSDDEEDLGSMDGHYTNS